MEESGEDEDDTGLDRRWVSEVRQQAVGDAYLNNEDEDGVLRIISRGIGTLEDTSLTGCSDHHGDSRVRQVYQWISRCDTRNKTREECRGSSAGVEGAVLEMNAGVPSHKSICTYGSLRTGINGG